MLIRIALGGGEQRFQFSAGLRRLFTEIGACQLHDLLSVLFCLLIKVIVSFHISPAFLPAFCGPLFFLITG